MAYVQELAKLDQFSLNLVNIIIKKLGEKYDNYDTLWSIISEKSFDSYEKKKIKKEKKYRKKSGYYLFSSNQEIRNKIKEEFPDEEHTIGFISAKLSQKWKNMAEEDKKIYIEKANEINNVNEKYNNSDKIKKKRKITAYNCFIGNKELRIELKMKNKSFTMIEINKLLADKWKNMSEQEKNLYKEQANLLNENNNELNSISEKEEETKEEETKEEETKEEETKKEEIKKEEIKKEETKEEEEKIKENKTKKKIKKNLNN